MRDEPVLAVATRAAFMSLTMPFGSLLALFIETFQYLKRAHGKEGTVVLNYSTVGLGWTL